LPTAGEQEASDIEDTPDVRVELTFPGPVTESNGAATGNTVRWTVTTDESELSARASAVPAQDRSTTFAFLVLGVVIVTGIAYWLAGVVGRAMRGPGRSSGRIRS
jgi:hypothetical protein